MLSCQCAEHSHVCLSEWETKRKRLLLVHAVGLRGRTSVRMVVNRPLGLAVGSVRPRPGLTIGPALVGLLGLALMGQDLG